MFYHHYCLPRCCYHGHCAQCCSHSHCYHHHTVTVPVVPVWTPLVPLQPVWARDAQTINALAGK